MEIAVLADIHGNRQALETCLEYCRARGVEQYVILGDLSGELPDVRSVLDLLQALAAVRPCVFVRGNREDYMLAHRAALREGRDDGWQPGNSASGCLWYNYTHLTPADLDFFQGMPLCARVRQPGLPDILCCHDAPAGAEGSGSLWPDSQAAEQALAAVHETVLLCGHTHVPFVLRQNGKMLLNPGALGYPIGRVKAQFALLRPAGGRWVPEHVALDYDVEGALARLEESGLAAAAPWWCAATRHALRTGQDRALCLLENAKRLCRQSEGGCRWPAIPEKYWAQAADELGIPLS